MKRKTPNGWWNQNAERGRGLQPSPAPVARFEIPDDARLELKRRWWNEAHPTPKTKPARKPTLFERIIQRLARLILKLALTVAYRFAPPAPARKRTPAYERRQALRRAALTLAAKASGV